MTQAQLFKYFFFGAFLVVLYQLFRIFSPFLAPLAGATVLALLCYPTYKWMLTRVSRRPGVAAALATATTMCIIVLPMALGGWLLVKEVKVMYPSVERWVKQATSPSGGLPSQNACPKSSSADGSASER